MSVFTNDNTFEEYQNQFIIKGEEVTMAGILDKAEARGKFNAIYSFIKKGRITLEEAASDVEMT